MKVSVKLDYSHIRSVGNVFIDRYGNTTYDEARRFVDTLHKNVHEESVISEFKSGWRDVIVVEFTEDALESFIELCVDIYVDDDISLETFTDITQPVQYGCAKKYWKEHLKALEDAPIVYRSRHANNLSTLVEACDDVIGVSRIIEVLMCGVRQNWNPLGRDNSPSQIVQPLNDEITDNEEDLNLEHPYFYQGPRSLGIIPSTKERSLSDCVCEYHDGRIYPFLLSEKDPVSQYIMDVTENMMGSE